MITNYSYQLEDYLAFERDVCTVEKVVIFKVKNPKIVNKNIELMKDTKAFKKKCDIVFTSADVDGGGSIDKEEFCSLLKKMWAGKPPTEKKIYEEFDKYDENGD